MITLFFSCHIFTLCAVFDSVCCVLSIMVVVTQVAVPSSTQTQPLNLLTQNTHNTWPMCCLFFVWKTFSKTLTTNQEAVYTETVFCRRIESDCCSSRCNMASYVLMAMHVERTILLLLT